MVKNERVTKIQEIVNERPLAPIGVLKKELSCSEWHIYKGVEELSKMGDKNAQIWVKTTPIRRPYRRFRHVLQLFAYAFKHGLTIEEVKEIELWGSGYSKNESVLSILNPKPQVHKRNKTLPNIKEDTIKLMNICCDYDPTKKQMRYHLTSEQISNVLRDYGLSG